MALLKSKEIAKMSKEEINEKLKELKVELIKSKVAGKKTALSPRNIKKTVARLLTQITLKNKNSKENKDIQNKQAKEVKK